MAGSWGRKKNSRIRFLSAVSCGARVPPVRLALRSRPMERGNVDSEILQSCSAGSCCYRYFVSADVYTEARICPGGIGDGLALLSLLEMGESLCKKRGYAVSRSGYMARTSGLCDRTEGGGVRDGGNLVGEEGLSSASPHHLLVGEAICVEVVLLHKEQVGGLEARRRRAGTGEVDGQLVVAAMCAGEGKGRHAAGTSA